MPPREINGVNTFILKQLKRALTAVVREIDEDVYNGLMDDADYGQSRFDEIVQLFLAVYHEED